MIHYANELCGYLIIILILILLYIQTWKDDFLTWDPSGYDGLTSIRLPVNNIWSPDIVLYNE